MAANMRTRKSIPYTLPPITLVGRHFAVLNPNDLIVFQGIVRGDLGEGYYLIQKFDAFEQEDVMEIRHISEMKVLNNHEMYWQFYEDNEHRKFWNVYRYAPPKDEAA